MSWRDERAKVLRSQPVQTAAEVRQEPGQSFDPSRWRGEIEALVDEMGRLDPGGGCWEWVKANLGEKWRELMTAMKTIDTTFEKQCAGSLAQEIEWARLLYHECVATWKKALSESGEKPNIS